MSHTCRIFFFFLILVRLCRSKKCYLQWMAFSSEARFRYVWVVGGSWSERVAVSWDQHIYMEASTSCFWRACYFGSNLLSETAVLWAGSPKNQVQQSAPTTYTLISCSWNSRKMGPGYNLGSRVRLFLVCLLYHSLTETHILKIWFWIGDENK